MAAGGAEILRAGMITSVGIGARQTFTSVRARLARFAESPFHDRRFEPFVMAIVPEDHLPAPAPTLKQGARTARHARMVRLAASALIEALEGVPSSSRIPLLLGAPEPLPGRANPAGPQFLEDLRAQSDAAFDVTRSRLIHKGRAAGLLAAHEAVARIAEGESDRVLIGGVDTFLDAHALGALDREGRILAHGVMDGFTPGEGAAFLLLGAPGRPKPNVGTPLARLEAVGLGREPGHRYSEEAYRGEGLAAAFQSLFAAAPEGQGAVRSILAGLNGEHFGSREWGVARQRHTRRFDAGAHVEHPVQSFGDTGAALAPLLLGLAALGLSRGDLEGPCMVWASSDREDRGAALIGRRAA
jgi:3-oxoacyl-[acyl-carrier-protein] synthase-1